MTTSTTTSLTATTPVGKIAASHPLATRVFARYGIDFCCGGGRPLAEVCTAKKLDTDSVLGEIEQEISTTSDPEVRWDLEPVGDLIDHILGQYHGPLKEELPRIEAMAQKVHQVHGDKDPALGEISRVFSALRADLEQHMVKEEQILFPMITRGQGGMASDPISVMESEHETAGALLARLRELTNAYQIPAGACNTWRALWVALAELERSLHEHIHLENNILHPRALAS